MSKVSDTFTHASIRLYFYLLERLSEPSTLRGVIMLLMGASATLRPDKVTAIFTIGSLAIGAAGALTPDAWRRAKRKLDRSAHGYDRDDRYDRYDDRDDRRHRYDHDDGDCDRGRVRPDADCTRDGEGGQIDEYDRHRRTR